MRCIIPLRGLLQVWCTRGASTKVSPEAGGDALAALFGHARPPDRFAAGQIGYQVLKCNRFFRPSHAEVDQVAADQGEQDTLLALRIFPLFAQ